MVRGQSSLGLRTSWTGRWLQIARRAFIVAYFDRLSTRHADPAPEWSDPPYTETSSSSPSTGSKWKRWVAEEISKEMSCDQSGFWPWFPCKRQKQVISHWVAGPFRRVQVAFGVGWPAHMQTPLLAPQMGRSQAQSLVAEALKGKNLRKGLTTCSHPIN